MESEGEWGATHAKSQSLSLSLRVAAAVGLGLDSGREGERALGASFDAAHGLEA